MMYRVSCSYWGLLCVVAMVLAACGAPEERRSEAANVDWLDIGNGFGEQRHSALDSINADNVHRLGLAWMFRDFVVRGRTHRGNQGTPVVVDGRMYFTGPWSVVYAVDAATGERIWTYDPQVEGAWARNACCDVNNKGVAVQGNRLFVGTVDGYLDAVDISTGERVWRSDTLIDRTRAYTVTGAPRIAGKVIVIGNGGADMGTRGYFSAYELDTGELAWRFFVVPGPPELGDEHPELAMARETWGPDSRYDIGLGGNPYDGMVYDPELDIIYVGTSNGAPHPTWLRDPSLGDNLFLSSIVAVKADTGRLVWHYQTVPADDWDFGSTQNLILADIEIGGAMRQVIMQAPKNGFFYVLDRRTGELLTAEPYTIVTWASHVDPGTGRPVRNEKLSYRDGPQIVWPSVSGGHNWQPMAFNPDLGLVFIPALEAPMKYVGYDDVIYQPGSINEGKGPPLMPPFEESDAHLLEGQPDVFERSMLRAWNPVTQEAVWNSPPQSWWSGGVLSTAGNVVFQGTVDGLFSVYDARNGALLKSIDTGLAILAPPMTYSIDGVQYVAVLGGLGGSESAYFPRASAAQRFGNPETLFVFKLDGDPVEMPPPYIELPEQPLPEVLPPDDAQLIAHGEPLFFHHCARCHSYRGSKGAYPDLWNMAPAIHAAWNEILMNGTFSYAGMAGYKDVLSDYDSHAIYAFIVNDQILARELGEEAEPEKREFGID